MTSYSYSVDANFVPPELANLLTLIVVLAVVVWMCCAAKRVLSIVQLKTCLDNEQVHTVKGAGHFLSALSALSADHTKALLSRRQVSVPVPVPAYHLPYLVTKLPETGKPAPLGDRPPSPTGVEPMCITLTLSSTCPVWVQAFWGVRVRTLEHLLSGGLAGLRMHRLAKPAGGVMIQSAGLPLEGLETMDTASVHGDAKEGEASGYSYVPFDDLASPHGSTGTDDSPRPASLASLTPTVSAEGKDDEFDLLKRTEYIARSSPQFFEAKSERLVSLVPPTRIAEVELDPSRVVTGVVVMGRAQPVSDSPSAPVAMVTERFALQPMEAASATPDASFASAVYSTAPAFQRLALDANPGGLGAPEPQLAVLTIKVRPPRRRADTNVRLFGAATAGSPQPKLTFRSRVSSLASTCTSNIPSGTTTPTTLSRPSSPGSTVSDGSQSSSQSEAPIAGAGAAADGSSGGGGAPLTPRTPTVRPPLPVLEEDESVPLSAEFYTVTHGNAYELMEVFGMSEGDDAGDDAEECVVCLTEAKDTMLLPCRHLCVCHECFAHLDKCPVCRAPFESHLVFEPQSES